MSKSVKSIDTDNSFQTYQEENDAADKCSTFNSSALSQHFCDGFGHTYSSLSDDNQCQQTHPLYKMRCFEAQHSPFTGYGDDNNAFEEHDHPPNREYGPGSHCYFFGERDRHSHKYTTGGEEGKETESDGKQKIFELPSSAEDPHDGVLYAKEESTDGE